MGAGFHYFLTREWAFTGAYRYWHASNGGYARPNRGVNVNTFFVGPRTSSRKVLTRQRARRSFPP